MTRQVLKMTLVKRKIVPKFDGAADVDKEACWYVLVFFENKQS